MLETFKNILKGIAVTASHLFSPQGAIYKAVAALIMYFSGLHTYLVIITALVIIDLALGVTAAMRRGEKFSSRKFRKGLLEKMLLYLMLLVTVFFVDQLFVKDFGFTRLFFSFFITFLISLYETTSIIENLAKLRPDIPFLVGLRRIFKKMGDTAMVSMEQKTDAIVNTVTSIENITLITSATTATTVTTMAGSDFQPE